MSTKHSIIDYNDIMKSYDPLSNKTSPFLSKYEKVTIIGTRAEQLQRGAEAYVDWDKTKPFDARTIAIQELAEKKLPFMLCRTLPDNSKEYFRLADVIDITR